ncbi:hypothetical protein SISSUDRAFT_1034367 [Sistotremastrum suecicum HHB10207 ss-3]|uniref:Uncharacterized protein n=1 Tax=Sistotremastrum suecicum HHB10207 ss-3 TaxID=1314776 RepID=A0A166C602_9AGAM|nr:hypothetical protein SISSUDRAFT_1034367 [Sistotremastrum suecicum HHB10207 ss-3]
MRGSTLLSSCNIDSQQIPDSPTFLDPWTRLSSGGRSPIHRLSRGEASTFSLVLRPDVMPIISLRPSVTVMPSVRPQGKGSNGKGKGKGKGKRPPITFTSTQNKRETGKLENWEKLNRVRFTVAQPQRGVQKFDESYEPRHPFLPTHFHPKRDETSSASFSASPRFALDSITLR